MDVLIFFLLLYIMTALAGVLGIFLLFFSKRIQTQKIAYYFIVIIGFLVIFFNMDRFPYHYVAHVFFTGLVILLSLISLIIERSSRCMRRFTVAKYLASLSVIVGIVSLFLL